MIGERAVNSDKIGIFIGGYRRFKEVLSWKIPNE